MVQDISAALEATVSKKCHFCHKNKKDYIIRLLEIEETNGVDRLTGYGIVICPKCEKKLQDTKIRIDKWRASLHGAAATKASDRRIAADIRKHERETAKDKALKKRRISSDKEVSNLVDLLERRL